MKTKNFLILVAAHLGLSAGAFLAIYGWALARQDAGVAVASGAAAATGVASAAACARVGLPCRVYMGAVDIERQAPNVDRMHRLGAEVFPVETGDKTLRAAIDEALREWVSDPDGIYYLLGSAVGAHPYPYLVRELQSVIGQEARQQFLDQAGSLPDAAFACVGGGSNAIGLFYPLVGDAEIELIGVEAGGTGYWQSPLQAPVPDQSLSRLA